MGCNVNVYNFWSTEEGKLDDHTFSLLYILYTIAEASLLIFLRMYNILQFNE